MHPRLQLVARRVRRWWLRAVSRFLTFENAIGLVGIAVAIVFGITASHPLRSDEIPDYYFSALIFGLTASVILICFFLLRFSVDIHTLTEREQARVASRFHYVAELQLQYEALVAVCVRHLFHSVADSAVYTDEKWYPLFADLERKFQEILRTICEDANYVITTAHRGTSEDASVNVKIFSASTSTGVYTYQVYHRFPKSDMSRRARDNRVVEVNNNMTYVSLHGKHRDDYLKSGICFIDDLDQYLSDLSQNNKMRELNDLAVFSEPAEEDRNYYLSSISVPLTADEPHISPRRVIGVLCIDSPERAYFNREYDVVVMKQLASQAYSVVRSLNAVADLRADFVSLRDKLAPTLPLAE